MPMTLVVAGQGRPCISLPYDRYPHRPTLAARVVRGDVVRVFGLVILSLLFGRQIIPGRPDLTCAIMLLFRNARAFLPSRPSGHTVSHGIENGLLLVSNRCNCARRRVCRACSVRGKENADRTFCLGKNVCPPKISRDAQDNHRPGGCGMRTRPPPTQHVLRAHYIEASHYASPPCVPFRRRLVARYDWNCCNVGIPLRLMRTNSPGVRPSRPFRAEDLLESGGIMRNYLRGAGTDSARTK